MTTNIPLRAVHVDDDPRSLQKLKEVLSGLADVEYVAGMTSADEALEFLQVHRVDIVFLDVEMPGHDGLWLAGKLRHLQVAMVFVTAYVGYAAQAFEACALDYLLKPVDLDRIEVVLERLNYRRSKGALNMREQIDEIHQYIVPRQRPGRLFIDMISRIEVVVLENVLYFLANRNYTTIIMADGQRHLVSKNIKFYSEALQQAPEFIRVSRSCIVHKKAVMAIERNVVTRKISLIISNGDEVETAFKNREQVKEML